jgi:hypothetical protein
MEAQGKAGVAHKGHICDQPAQRGWLTQALSVTCDLEQSPLWNRQTDRGVIHSLTYMRPSS